MRSRSHGATNGVDGAPARAGVSTAATLAGRIGRHALLYAAGAALLVAASVATLAVFTRLMPPAEFGKLVVLLALAAGLSTLFHIATLQGTIGLVFGASEDDGASLEEEEASEAPEADSQRAREPPHPRLAGSGSLKTR